MIRKWIQRSISQKAVRTLKAPNLAKVMASEGVEVIASTLVQLGVYMRSETEKWGRVVDPEYAACNQSGRMEVGHSWPICGNHAADRFSDSDVGFDAPAFTGRLAMECNAATFDLLPIFVR
jgi:hypothetical protein